MLYVITGGSGSGKSQYAEQLATHIYSESKIAALASGINDEAGEEPRLYYVATMHPTDEECLNRIKKHRLMRKDKGFLTMECSCSLEQIRAGRGDVVLLECMSNLLANEMYLEKGGIKAIGQQAEEQVEEVILKPLKELEKNAAGVIVVTNEVFSNGMHYDEETEKYCRLLGKINVCLGKLADVLVEVVCAIPLYKKGGTPC